MGAHMSSHALASRHLIIPLIMTAVVGFVGFLGHAQVQTSKELGFYSLSPLGEATGRSVPASCPSNLHDSANYGQACAATNACNQTNYGVYQCGGTGTVCSAAAPAMPTNYGQSCTFANSCNGNQTNETGTIGCDGLCHANGNSGFGSACFSTAANSCGMRANGTVQCDGTCSAVNAPSDALCTSTENAPTSCELHTTPSQVFKNARTILSWSSVGNNTTCSITARSSAGNAVLQVISSLAGVGSVVSDKLTEDSDFSLTCTNAGGSCTSNNAHVRVIGTMTWIEF